MAVMPSIVLLHILLLSMLHVYSCEQIKSSEAESSSRLLSANLSKDYSKFRVKSALTSTNGTEFCIEVVPSLNKIIINVCDDDSNLQVWFFDEENRIQSLAQNPARSNAGFVYNPIDKTIQSMMLYFTILNETAEINKTIFLTERNSCLVGQKWFLKEIVPDNQLKFLGNPCTGENGCPLCTGDCDNIKGCEGNLRCLQVGGVAIMHPLFLFLFFFLSNVLHLLHIFNFFSRGWNLAHQILGVKMSLAAIGKQ